MKRLLYYDSTNRCHIMQHYIMNNKRGRLNLLDSLIVISIAASIVLFILFWT